jgi:hypothetical protein
MPTPTPTDTEYQHRMRAQMRHDYQALWIPRKGKKKGHFIYGKEAQAARIAARRKKSAKKA